MVYGTGTNGGERENNWTITSPTLTNGEQRRHEAKKNLKGAYQPDPEDSQTGTTERIKRRNSTTGWRWKWRTNTVVFHFPF